MAFMGIFLLVIILMVYVLVLAILMIVYVITFIYALLGAIISGIVWLVKKRKGKRRDVPLAFLISYGLILSVLIGIGAFEVGNTALVYGISELEDRPVKDLGVYIEETFEEIAETHTITFNGIEYHRCRQTSSLYLGYNDVPNRRLTPIANIPECTKYLVYDLENDAGVTMLACAESIFLTTEDTERMLEYYCNDTQSHNIYIRCPINSAEAKMKMDVELYNQLYNELRSRPKEIVENAGITRQFYVNAISHDKIVKRKILMTYSPSKGEIYFDIGHTEFQVQSREARDIIYPYVIKYVPPPST